MFVLITLVLLPGAASARPIPIDQASWITTDDYPAVSNTVHEQGKIAYRLSVSDKGRVDDCKIVRSSGFGNLDDATCRLIVDRARFQPGIGGTFDSNMRWSIEELADSPALAASRGSVPTVPKPTPSTLPPIRMSPPTGRSLLRTPAPSLADMSRACAIGSTPPKAGSNPATYAEQGSTPIAVDGAVTVSPGEAKCLLDRFSGTVLIADATGESGNLADAFNVNLVGHRNVNQGAIDEMQYELNVISGGNRAMPILVYCHHASCGLSYYASQHIVAVGYTSVLWMRDGIEGWRKAGYAFTNVASRWEQPVITALQAWQSCILRQPVPDSGDPAQLLARSRSACRTEERAQHNSFGAWRSTTARDEMMAALARRVDDLESSHINVAQAQARRVAAELAQEKKKLADADEWRRQQGISLPASQLMDGFQFCFAGADDASFNRTWYYSSIYPTRIAKSNAANLNYYNQLNALGHPVDGTSYAVFVEKTIKPAKGTFGGCVFSPTLAGVQAELVSSRRSLGGPDAQDLPWIPR